MTKTTATQKQFTATLASAEAIILDAVKEAMAAEAAEQIKALTAKLEKIQGHDWATEAKQFSSDHGLDPLSLDYDEVKQWAADTCYELTEDDS